MGKLLGGKGNVGLAIESRLELASRGGFFGLRSGGRGRRRGSLSLGQLLLRRRGGGGSITASVFKGEILESIDIGALLDQDGNRLLVGAGC